MIYFIRCDSERDRDFFISLLDKKTINTQTLQIDSKYFLLIPEESREYARSVIEEEVTALDVLRYGFSGEPMYVYGNGDEQIMIRVGKKQTDGGQPKYYTLDINNIMDTDKYQAMSIKLIADGYTIYSVADGIMSFSRNASTPCNVFDNISPEEELAITGMPATLSAKVLDIPLQIDLQSCINVANATVAIFSDECKLSNSDIDSYIRSASMQALFTQKMYEAALLAARSILSEEIIKRFSEFNVSSDAKDALFRLIKQIEAENVSIRFNVAFITPGIKMVDVHTNKINDEIGKFINSALYFFPIQDYHINFYVPQDLSSLDHIEGDNLSYYPRAIYLIGKSDPVVFFGKNADHVMEALVIKGVPFVQCTLRQEKAIVCSKSDIITNEMKDYLCMASIYTQFSHGSLKFNRLKNGTQ